MKLVLKRALQCNFHPYFHHRMLLNLYIIYYAIKYIIDVVENSLFCTFPNVAIVEETPGSFGV